MDITDIIRKYNNTITTLEAGKKEASKELSSFNLNQIHHFDSLINACRDFIKDLQYIGGQMPTINPIEKGHYNDAPEGLEVITLDEWQRGMFDYSLCQSHSKQVRGEQTFDLRLFDVPNFENKKLGYAIMNDWFDKEKGRNRPKNIVRFCRYGTDADWIKFEKRFNAQFAGDNS